MNNHFQRRGDSAFTLIEVVLSSAIMAILMMAIASAIVLASRAIPDSTKPMDQAVEVAAVTDWIKSDLQYAIHMPQRTENSITLIVADRDGDGLPETINYAWSGKSGDPLTRTYNDGTAKSILDNVDSLSFELNLQPRQRDIRVLLVMPDASSLTANDESKKARMEGWGFDVTSITVSSSQAAYDEATSVADVAYVSEDIATKYFGRKLTSTPIGVIFEDQALVDEFYVSNGAYDYIDDRIMITNDSHPITAGFIKGALVLFDSDQEMACVNGTIANGVTALARRRTGTHSSLLVVGVGGELLSDQIAVGRRVFVPWGGESHVFDELTADGLTLMKRCIEWAAGDHVVTGVQINLQATGQASAVEVRARVMNRMAVP